MPGALKGQRAYSPGQSISDTPGFNACKGCRPEWAKALYAKRKLFIDNMLYDIVILSANAFALPGRSFTYACIPMALPWAMRSLGFQPVK